MTARSRSKASELGLCSHSFRLALGNSRPMTGVTSKDSKDSREPLSFKGSFWRDLVAEAVSLVTGTTGVGMLSIVAGAISAVWNLPCSGYHHGVFGSLFYMPCYTDVWTLQCRVHGWLYTLLPLKRIKDATPQEYCAISRHVIFYKAICCISCATRARRQWSCRKEVHII